jgi:hypothetical protein
MNKLAKLGIAVPLLTAGAAVGTAVAANLRFKKMVADEVAALFAAADQTETAVVTPEMLAHLPEPVHRYLVYTGVVGKPMVNTVRLRQRGKFRMSAEQPWFDVTAEEYYSISPSAFIWVVTVKKAGIILVLGRDSYRDGTGHMLITLSGLVPVVNAKGTELNQGSMIRFLNEMIWFPAALLRDNITWTAVNDHTAQVTLTDQGEAVTGTLFFDDDGKLLNFEAPRYRMEGEEFVYTRWSTPLTEYGERAGLQLPVKGSAVWHLPDGDFDYVELEITEIEYNQPFLYEMG